MVDPDDYDLLRIYPTVKPTDEGFSCFEVPLDAVMTEELLAFIPCVSEDKELRARWVDKIDEGFAIGESLAMETLAIAARSRGSGNWGLGEILRAAIVAEHDDALEYVARGFIHTIVSAAISGHAPLARRRRSNGDASDAPPPEAQTAKSL